MSSNSNTTPSFIDIGVNLTNSRFDKDRDEVIQNACSSGVISQIITGTSLQESISAFELTQNYDNLFSTAGCHPHDAKDFNQEALFSLKQLLQNPKVVAVGECGLDFNRNFSPPEVQESVFRQQLELAIEVDKPLFLHERDASEQMLKILANYQSELPKLVIHCFTGDRHTLEAYLDRGCYIGITGWVCDERRGQELADIIHLIPDNRLMIETDSPYLIPRDLRPKPKSNRNLPEYLPHIAKKVAECRSQTWEHIAATSCQNTIEFFNLKIIED